MFTLFVSAAVEDIVMMFYDMLGVVLKWRTRVELDSSPRAALAQHPLMGTQKPHVQRASGHLPSKGATPARLSTLFAQTGDGWVALCDK
jgi:hypothetical protein